MEAPGRSNPTDGREDPIGYFIQDMEFHGKSERTKEAYERVLREFERFLADPDRNPSGKRLTPADAGERDCMAWIHNLRGELGASTIATYASYLHRFYAYMNQVGVLSENPMTLVMEELDESIEKDPDRREISLPEMREFVAALSHPLDRAVVVCLLKTGMRVGELCNLDLRDIAIEDPELEEVYALGTRPQLSGRPDSIYVDSEPQRDVIVNGERRSASNKRQRSTIVPIDAELKAVLKAYLAIRPEAISDAKPLFVATKREWGKRLTPQAVRSIVSQPAKERGWYRKGGGASENVTPHYFRHFFTTHMRDRTGDRGVVKYLRGDVADDIIDTYTHNWGDSIRRSYVENIYSIL